MENTPPRAVLVYVAFLSLISLNTTVLGYLAPHLLFGDILDWDNAAPVTMFYATRNMAVLGLCVVALLSRNAGMLFAAVLTRLLIESGDLFFTLQLGLVSQPDAIVFVGWVAVFTGPQLWCLWRLRHSGAGWRFHFREDTSIQVDAQTAWETLEDHTAMPDWVRLGLRKVQLFSRDDAPIGTVGSIREIHFVGWSPVRERFTLIEAPHQYQYTVTEGMPHLREHLGIVRVVPSGAGISVQWEITFVFHPLHPLSWAAPLFVFGFQRVVRNGLANLKQQLEA